ncbi:MAG: hypothetical protein MJY41_02415 [Bacteroidales bacterium]|nr:hypothetical protein [Bacteroidales bacterium]
MDSLGTLPTVFARKCSVRRIDKITAAAFLNANHRMGDATSRYRYGAFLNNPGSGMEAGTLVAVATFSNARKMKDGTRSYEWIRYASLEGTRVVGGMGKLLEAFAREIQPDDVMTYVDAAVSDGASYTELGFSLAGKVSRKGFTNLKFRKLF